MKQLILITFLFFIFVNSIQASEDNDINFRLNVGELIPGADLYLNLDYKISESWTAGPELGYQYHGISEVYQSAEVQRSGFNIGVRFNWHKNGFNESGFYTGPSLSYNSISVSARGGEVTVNKSEGGLYAGSTFGYAWFRKSFNMFLGAGLRFAIKKISIEYTDSNGSKYNYTSKDIILPIEYSIGWTF